MRSNWGALFVYYNSKKESIQMKEKNNPITNDDKIIQKEKKSWKIATFLTAITSIFFLATLIICIFSDESHLIFMSLLFFALTLITTISFAYTYKTRTNDDWLKHCKQKNQPQKGLEKIGIYLKPKNETNSAFSPTRTIEIMENSGVMTRLFTRDGASTKLLVNNPSKTFIYQKGAYKSKTYNFSDLINYEVYENGQSQVQGRAGSALIGGAFFGLGGMIVGSSMSRNINDKCNQLQLIIRLNDFNSPQIIIDYCKNSNLDKSSILYRNIKNNLQTVCSMLEYMLNEKTLEQSSAAKKEAQPAIKVTGKDQLKELKEMLDDGLITQEDYEKKKKQILGI